MRFQRNDSSELSQPKLNEMGKMAHKREEKEIVLCWNERRKKERRKKEGRKEGREKEKKKKKKDVYNIWYSRVVTLPSTNQTISRLTAMSGTGMGTFDCVWS